MEMDPFHYHTQHQHQPQPQPKPHQEEKCNITTKPHHQNNSSSSNSYLCRQTSTRWIPTSEQIRILRDLYYNCGVRSPNSEEIQRISAMLRQYGKIEGKNVFYWFQNHKARERQKKRLTVEVNNGVNIKPNANALLSPGALPPTVGVSTPSSSACLYGVSPTENSAYTGPMLTERNLNIEFNMNDNGEISQIQNSNGGVELDQIRTTPWQMPPHYEQSAATVAVTRELETLQLFPVKSEAEPSDHVQLVHFHQEPADPYFPFPQFSSNFSCCNPSFYYQQQLQLQQVQLQQNEENQCSYSQPTTTSLELTLGSYFFSPAPYPGPM